jgi:hypothetical protein
MQAGSWIGGRVFDLCFFFGAGVLAVGAGLLALALPATILPMWFLWLWLIEGPHLVATWQRTYLDARCRRERRRMLWSGMLWMLPAPLALWASWLLGRPEVFLLMLAAAALWSYHHAVRQHHGIVSVYQRLGGASESARQLDRRLLHGTLWGAFALFLLIHGVNRAQLGLPPALNPVEDLAATVLAVALALAVCAWGVVLAVRWRRGEAVKPGLLALCVALGCTLFALFAVGMREPLLPGALTPEQVFMAASVVAGIVHGMQYLGMVIATSRRRAREDIGLAALFGRRPLLAYGAMVLVSLLYVWLTFLREAPPPGHMEVSRTAQMFLAVYWGLFFQHYWLDQQIWKPSSDARLREELGLAKQHPGANGGSGSAA